MIGRNETWWRAALEGAVLASGFSGGCSATVVHAPSDAAVSDIVVIDMPPAMDAPVVDMSPAVDASLIDTAPAIDTPPVACDAGTVRCGASCVDTTTDASHCGACDRACETTWSCVMGTCACAAGQHLVGTVCVADDAPRPLAPISLGDVTQRRPTLRWALPPGIDGAVVELCRDRACTSIIETLRVTGTSARPTADLPARSAVFWRMRGRVGTVARSGASPTWIFHVPATSASTAVDTSYNPHFDTNGDGFDDVIVGARVPTPDGRGRVGTASVFYGSPTWIQPLAGTARTPDRLFEGGPTSEGFNSENFSLAGAGDVNGDGYADLVLGACSIGRDTTRRAIRQELLGVEVHGNTRQKRVAVPSPSGAPCPNKLLPFPDPRNHELALASRSAQSPSRAARPLPRGPAYAARPHYGRAALTAVWAGLPSVAASRRCGS